MAVERALSSVRLARQCGRPRFPRTPGDPTVGRWSRSKRTSGRSSSAIPELDLAAELAALHRQPTPASPTPTPWPERALVEEQLAAASCSDDVCEPARGRLPARVW